MAFTKTRIWRGGSSEVEAPVAEPPAVAAEPPVCSAEEAEVFERTAAQLSASGSLGFDVPPSSPLAVTRFLPIEQLFSEPQHQHQNEREPAALTPVPSVSRFASLWGRLRLGAVRYESVPVRPRPLRRALFVALSIALAAAAALTLPLAQRRLGAVHAASARSGARASGPAAITRALEPPTELPAPGHAPFAQRQVRAAPKPQGLERSAVDALISGDLERATQIYGRLADGAPHEPVYREARRILLNQISAP